MSDKDTSEKDEEKGYQKALNELKSWFDREEISFTPLLDKIEEMKKKK